MTAILKDLRSLKAARDRGEITPAQYARAERVLLEMVEEAVIDGEAVEVTPAPPRQARPPEPRPEPHRAEEQSASPARAWETALMIVAGASCATLLLAVLIDSVTLALTLLVTMIAAASIWALRHFDE